MNRKTELARLTAAIEMFLTTPPQSFFEDVKPKKHFFASLLHVQGRPPNIQLSAGLFTI